jgi:hypothetical protein
MLRRDPLDHRRADTEPFLGGLGVVCAALESLLRANALADVARYSGVWRRRPQRISVSETRTVGAAV